MIPSLNSQYSRALGYLSKEIPSTFAGNVNILDVGCGGGTILLNLANSIVVNQKQMLIGLDLSLNALTRLRKLARRINLGSNIALIQASGDSLPIRDSAVRILICTHVLEHIKDDNTAFRETVRVLARKGYYCLSAPRPFLSVSPIHMPLMYIMGLGVGHVRSGYRSAEILSRFKRNGFKVLAFLDNTDVVSYLLYQYPLALATLIKRVLGGGEYQAERLSGIKRFAGRVDAHIPPIPRFGSGYTVIATESKD